MSWVQVIEICKFDTLISACTIKRRNIFYFTKKSLFIPWDDLETARIQILFPSRNSKEKNKFLIELSLHRTLQYKIEEGSLQLIFGQAIEQYDQAKHLTDKINQFIQHQQKINPGNDSTSLFVFFIFFLFFFFSFSFFFSFIYYLFNKLNRSKKK